MKPTLIKFAASTMAIGASLVSFAPIANSNNVAESESREARAAAGYAEEAREALAENRSERAIRYAERAVERMPRSAEYRHLLGRVYLAEGRFASAETSFQDALTLNPDLDRTQFNLALSQIAQGNQADALEELRDLEGRISASDLGLAYALSGNRERAIDILQQAARANGGDPRARQNLALTYALDGRWAEARITASQDISPALVDQRMRDWALYASPTNSWDQVAGLLGVESDGNDAGQPQRLALAPAVDDNVMMADASATPEVTETAEAPTETPVVAFTAPVEAPANETYYPAYNEESSIVEVDVPPVIEADAEPVRIAPSQETVASSSDFIVEDEVQYAAVTDVAPPAAPIAPQAAPSAPPAAPVALRTVPEPAPVATPVAAPAPAPAPQPAPTRRNGNGAYYVQLGAFSRASNVDVAWNRAVARHAALSDFEPSRALFERGRTLYRLSFGGFETRAEANSMCRTLRRKRVDCFVRARAGDSPLRIAARSGAGYASHRRA